MMLKAWRIIKTKYLDEAFSGEGARLYGGRWNSQGRGVVYTAQHASLAVLEILVHLESTSPLFGYVLIQVEFDPGLLEILDIETLPDQWRVDPPPAELQSIGDEWFEQRRSVVLRVPSAVLPIENVYLLNPEHPDFDQITLHDPLPLPIDRRLINR
jgi:RES domain-containing protein